MLATLWPISAASSSTWRSPWASTSTSSARRPLPSALATSAKASNNASFACRSPIANLLKELLDNLDQRKCIFKTLLEERGDGGNPDVRRRGPRPLLLPRRPRRRHGGDPRPAPLPEPAPGGGDGSGDGTALDDRHPLPRRLRDRQPGAGRRRRHHVHRTRSVEAGDPASRRARRGTDHARPRGDVDGDRHARPHPRPPRLPARARRHADSAVHRRLVDGRRRRTHRPVRSGTGRAAGPRHVPLAAPPRRPARRPGRVPDPRRRLVLLRSRRRRPDHHARTGTCHQPPVPCRRRGHLRRAAAGRVRFVPDLLHPAARAEPARTAPLRAAPPARPARRRHRRTVTSTPAR